MTPLAAILHELEWSGSGDVWSPEEDFGTNIPCCPVCQGAMPEQYKLLASKGWDCWRHHTGHKDDCSLKEALSIAENGASKELSEDLIADLANAHLEHYKFLRAVNGAGAPVVGSLMASYRLGVSRALQIAGIEHDSIASMFHAVDALGID